MVPPDIEGGPALPSLPYVLVFTCLPSWEDWDRDLGPALGKALAGWETSLTSTSAREEPRLR